MTSQRTIGETVSIAGTGLQTGCAVTVTFRPAPEDAGIVFRRTDLPGTPALDIRSLSTAAGHGPDRRTTIGTDALQVQTIEHLLAALAGLGVTNISIEIDAVELPGLDGSAQEYLALLTKAGVVEQKAVQPVLRPAAPVWCEGKGGAFLAAFPADRPRITYTLAYPHPAIGTQYLDILLDEKTFRETIAPARTFCLETEAEILIKQGYGKGATYQNTLVMAEHGPVKNTLRFPDEPVRHKVLDLIGDLSLAGMPVCAHIVAMKSGHALNMELVRRLKEAARGPVASTQ